LSLQTTPIFAIKKSDMGPNLTFSHSKNF